MASAARTVSIAFLGDTKSLENSLARAGLVAEDTSKKIRGSANAAGEAAAKQAATMGKSADEQAAAAAKAAAAYTEMAAKVTRAQRAAGDAAAATARAVGASVDQQRAAYARAVATQGEHEAATKKAAVAQEEAGARSQKFGTQLATMGKWAAVGLGGVGYEATKMGEKFQTATASIAANSGITQQAADAIGKAFLSTAGHSIYSGQQMASAFAPVAGQLRLLEGHALSASEAMKVMSAAGDLAEATHASLNTTTAALSQTMLTYHMSVQQAAGASDVLYNVSRSLNVPVDNVAQALAKMHARLGVLAPSLRDMSSLMVAFGREGLTGTRGIMMVSTALNTMLAPSKQAKSTLDQLHVSLTNSRGQFVGMAGVISQLQPKFAQMTSEQQRQVAQVLFGKSAWQAMLQVIQAGTGTFNQSAQAATKVGSAHQAANQQSKTFHDTMLRLKAAVEDLAVRFGSFLIPKIAAVASALSSGITWLEKHKAAATALAGVITGVLGVAIGAFMVNRIASFINSTKNAISAVNSFAGGVGKAAAAIAAKFGLIAASSETTAATVTASDTTIEAENTAAGASFGTMAGEAGAGAAGVGAAAGTMAAETEAADTAIEGANVAAGASFAELAAAGGPIALAIAALVIFHQQIISVQNDIQSFLSSLGTLGDALGGAFGGITGLGASFGSGGLQQAPTPPGSLLSNIGNFGTTPAASTGSSGSVAAAGLGGASGLSSIPTLPKYGSGIPGLGIPSLGGAGSGGSGGGSGGSGGSHTGTTHTAPTVRLPAFTISGKASWFNHGIGEAGPGPGDANNQGQASGLPFSQPGIAVYNQGTLGGYYAVRDPRTGQTYVVRQSDIGPAPGTGRVVDFNWQAMQTLLGGHDPTDQQFSLGYIGKSLPSSLAPYLNKAIPPSAISGQQMTTTVQQAVKTLLYANPFAHASNLVRERVDMGQDFSMSPGSPIGAIGAGQVVGMMGNWYPHDGNPNGGNYLAYKLTQGPNAGKVIYVAEQINPTVHQGQTLSPGQTIGTFASQGSGIEMGFASPSNPLQTLAQATGQTGDSSHGNAPAGIAFQQFLAQIGGGTYTTTQGGVTSTPSGPTAADLLAAAIKKYNDALKKAGNTILKSMTDLTDYDKGLAKKLEEVLNITLTTKEWVHYATGLGFTPSFPVKDGKGFAGFTGPDGKPVPVNMAQAYKNMRDHVNPRGLHMTYAGELGDIWKGFEQLGPSAKITVPGVGTETVSQTFGLPPVYGNVHGTGTETLSSSKGPPPVFGNVHGPTLSLTDKQGIPTEAGYDKYAVPILARAEKSGQLNDLIVQLKASHDKALQKLATDLVAEHKKALVTLAQQLYSEQLKKDAEEMDQQTQHLKDLTNLQQHLDQAQLDVFTAQVSARHDAADAATTLVGLQTTLAHDSAAAVVTNMDNQTTIIRDSYSAMVQAVQDATQAMADASEGIVSGIQDQTAIKVDILGERGLFGLNLVAQQLQVIASQDKAYWDQQINLAKINVDQVTTSAHVATADAQNVVNQVTLQQDQLVAAAQQSTDTVAIQEAITVAAAQQAADAVNIADQIKIASAQQAADTFELTGDTNQQLAQIASDLSANLPQAQQNVAQENLAFWTSYNAKGQAWEAANVQKVTDAARQDMAGAAGMLQSIQDAAANAIALSTQKYQGIQDAATLAIATANQHLADVTGHANMVITEAQRGLQSVTDSASQVLAKDQASIDVMRETASTQYAGSGLVVNVYGLNPTDGQAVASEVGWAMRQHVPA